MLYRNFIGGAWQAGADSLLNRNPSDIADVIGEYAQADAAQADAAIAAAAAASVAWRHSNPQLRATALDFVGSEILQRKEELGDLLAREEGKTTPEGVGEVMRAGQIFKFFAGEALRMRGDHLASVRPGIEVDVTREALGVVGLITPWNFPIAIPAWKIAPALAYGNCVVFKPAEFVPGSAWALAEIISRAGLPDGVFNLVMGSGRVVGAAFVGDRRVNGISFTGSVATGRNIAADGIARMAKLQLEMGGKNPLVVLDDADLDNAVECAVQGAFYSTGQRCTASSRIIVTPGVHDRFVAAFAERTRRLRVGDARDSQTQIGPVVEAGQLEKNLEYVQIGQDEGAELVCGGARLEDKPQGYFMQPAILANADNAMRTSREEIFGPVASVMRARDYEHALALANDTEFGLSAGICTTSLRHATHFKRHSEAGMVMVNVPTAGVDYHVPFGGRKESSYGSREQGTYAAEFYTTVKTAYTAA